MFAATPRLRDLLDLRTVLLVALFAAGAFGLQLAFLADTVASPLGGAIADFERVPQVESAPREAIARAHRTLNPAHDAREGTALPWERATQLAIDYAPPPQECPVAR